MFIPIREDDPIWLQYYLSVGVGSTTKQERCAQNAFYSNQSLRPLCLPGTISRKMLPQPTNRKGPHFFCFRPGKMGRIWRSFCWKRATVFMASFDDPLVSIPHVSIISSTRREWWGMMGGCSKWLMWLMWLRCDWDVIEMSLRCHWCDWCDMWLKITLFLKLYAMWMLETFCELIIKPTPSQTLSCRNGWSTSLIRSWYHTTSPQKLTQPFPFQMVQYEKNTFFYT